MIRLLYFDIRDMQNDAIDEYLEKLPLFMVEEIRRYYKTDDRKSRLIGRLMLMRCLQESGKEYLISCWNKNAFGKPYIPGWNSFNIAHAGHMVVLASSATDVGVDIEKNIDIDYHGIAESFHLEEQLMLQKTKNRQKLFFEIWTKKEALIKAWGIGIINGLDNFSCALGKVKHNSVTWYFRKVFIDQQYTCHICSSNKKEWIEISAFRL